MQPWWDNAWLWSGVGIVVLAIIAAIVVIVLIVSVTRSSSRDQT